MLLLLIFPTFAFAYIAHLSLHKCNIFTSGVHKNAFVKYLYFTYLNASHYDILFSFTLFSSLNKCFIFCLVLLYSHCI